MLSKHLSTKLNSLVVSKLDHNHRWLSSPIYGM